jgi:hypothetical protein
LFNQHAVSRRAFGRARVRRTTPFIDSAFGVDFPN